MVARILNASQEARLGWTIAYRVTLACLAAIAAGGVTMLTLYADRHNDERYVRSAEYLADKARDREMRDVEKRGDERLREQSRLALDQRLSDIKDKLTEIATDVKSAKK
jgi:hypothetical protein